MYPHVLSKVLIWVKTHGYRGIEFEEWDEHVWVFIRCYDKNVLRRVFVAILNRFSSNVTEEAIVLRRVIDDIGTNALVVFQCTPGHMGWLRRMSHIWVMRISRNSWSTRSLTCACSSGVSSEEDPASLALWNTTP